MADQTLAPCPFCGGEALLVNNREARKLWRVSCKNCDASPLGGFSEDEAISAWNRRASPPAAVPDGLMDALKSAEKALRPFFNAVFNDNGDMTVHGGYRYHEAVTGYWAYKRVRDALSAAPAAPNGWRSVQNDPPPKDGRWILATNIGWHGDCEVLGWHFGAWRRSPNTDSDDFTITHWMPLPAAPAEASDE